MNYINNTFLRTQTKYGTVYMHDKFQTKQNRTYRFRFMFFKLFAQKYLYYIIQGKIQDAVEI